MLVGSVGGGAGGGGGDFEFAVFHGWFLLSGWVVLGIKNGPCTRLCGARRRSMFNAPARLRNFDFSIIELFILSGQPCNSRVEETCRACLIASRSAAMTISVSSPSSQTKRIEECASNRNPA